MEQLSDGENHTWFAGGFFPNFLHVGKRYDLGCNLQAGRLNRFEDAPDRLQQNGQTYTFYSTSHQHDGE